MSICSVVNLAHRAVRLDKGVVSVYDITIATFMLGFMVSGMRVSHCVCEVVFRMSLENKFITFSYYNNFIKLISIKCNSRVYVFWLVVGKAYRVCLLHTNYLIYFFSYHVKLFYSVINTVSQHCIMFHGFLYYIGIKYYMSLSKL